MAVNILILVSVFAFYALIFLVGIWAARVTRRRKSATASETITVGARDVGVFLGTCTLTATYFGGGAVNGTDKGVSDPNQGLLWAIAVPGYGIGLILTAVFFVPKMRDSNYVTSLDPFEAKYGKYAALIFFIIETVIGVLHTAAILNALGGTLEVIPGLHRIPSVIISAVTALIYTMLGGLYSVAYTDVIQLYIICASLALSLPFALSNDAVTSISETAQQKYGWLGTWNLDFAGAYVDVWLLVASEREIMISIRIFMILFTAASCATALSVDSILGLMFLCSDVMYVFTLPQFISVIYLDPNAYGFILSLPISLVLRLGGGERLLNWPAPFSYVGGSNFPIKTVSMLTSLITLTVFSYVVKFLFEKGYIHEKYDILHSKLACGGRTRFFFSTKTTPEHINMDLPTRRWRVISNSSSGH